MTVSQNLQDLIDAVARLFVGEAAVFYSYWDLPARTAESDRTWIRRQAR